jgi:hypothetical protein
MVSSFFVAAGLLPLLTVRDVGKLAKIGSYGVLAIFYNVGFLLSSAFMDISQTEEQHQHLLGRRLSGDAPRRHLADGIKTVGSMSDIGVFVGMMGLSLFIHSVLLPIAGKHAKLQSQPQLVKRDLGFAFFMAVVFYVFVGAMPALAFMLGKDVLPQYKGESELPQNILLGYRSSNLFALVGRFVLVLQIGVVYPILITIIRTQFFCGCLNRENAGKGESVVFTLIILVLTTLVSSVYPHPGTVVGLVGTYTAIVYMIWLPLLVHISASKTVTGRRSRVSTVSHVLLGVACTAIMLVQFVA